MGLRVKSTHIQHLRHKTRRGGDLLESSRRYTSQLGMGIYRDLQPRSALLLGIGGHRSARGVAIL